MTTSAQSRSRVEGARIGSGVLWLFASGFVAACSLLAPDDGHYLSAPSASGSRGAGGAGGVAAGAGGLDAPSRGGVGGVSGSDAGGASAGRAGGVAAGAGGLDAPSLGGVSGSDAGRASAGGAATDCGGDFADCNHQAGDGCEVDLRSSSANCGGCGKAFACAADEACEGRACVSVSGCSDGMREAFLPSSTWPHLAGCTAQWPRSSLRHPKTGSACGFELGVCEVPADACGKGWHVCAIPPFGPAEVRTQATAEECAAQPGAFVAAVGDQSCEPCTEGGTGAACCGELCVQQNGSCIYPGMTAWFGVYNDYVNVCGAIESDLVQRGVLCCRAP